MTGPARCYDHREWSNGPAVETCRICRRIDIERRIISNAIDTLILHGFYLNTNNGGLDDELDAPTQDRAAIFAAMMETDDEHLKVFTTPEAPYRFGWIHFVYGNGGHDVISDYTTNLENVLRPVNAFADSMEGCAL